uniref:Uncharacterized protein n=1 Tax=Nymphaea colorata TaxID=210225 RepID=A0A5K0Y5P8_9MAGN
MSYELENTFCRRPVAELSPSPRRSRSINVVSVTLSPPPPKLHRRLLSLFQVFWCPILLCLAATSTRPET